MFHTGCKFHIKTVRQNLLSKQKEFLRLQQDLFYEEISSTGLQDEFARIDKQFKIDKVDTERNRLKDLQRNRVLVCWHDSSSVSNASHFLVMISTLYDPAIFLTDNEYHVKTGVY